MLLHKTFSAFIVLSLVVSQSSAQQIGPQAPPQVVEKPHGPLLFRSYMQTSVPPVELRNTDHLHSLIRAGHLYLTVQDAIALAIENNLDLEVDRYGPLSAEWQLQRAQAGGPLRGVPSGNSLVNQATSGQGVVGSQIAAGLASNSSGNIGNTGGTAISQIGPVTQNLDPVLQNADVFAHTTSPQTVTLQSGTDALIDARHTFQTFVQEGFLSGGYAQVATNESYLKENSPSDFLNPSVEPVVNIYLRHNFLQGFGTGVNSRFIRVAQKNLQGAQETFRSQLLNLVSNVLNLYWDLVTDDNDLAVRQRAVDQAQKFYDDTRKQIELGVIPRFEASRAQSGLSNSRQLLDIAQATAQQQENLLKNALSRNGLEDPLLDAAQVVTLDRIEIPEQDNLPALRDLVAKALANRPDFALAKINDETSEISALGTANGVLPTLQGIASASAVGLSGTPTPPVAFNGQTYAAEPYYVGGLGNALGQVFRDNFQTHRAAIQFQGTLRNHVAQGDYGVDQLQLRQGDLLERRDQNQLVVDISNYMVALRQARSRYSQAVDSRNLQQELLDKSQQSFSFGAATISDVQAAETALVAAQETEVTASSAYSHARISLDQVLGQTLDVNHVSVGQALNGARAATPQR
jgi:outer membrane protein TolC